MNRTRHLKVKVKALAEEARIIRKEERRTRGMERWHLQHHRKTTVRSEARHSLLAYAFLRGRSYAQAESSTCSPPSWPRIKSIAIRFGGDAEAFDAWQAAAEAHLSCKEVAA